MNNVNYLHKELEKILPSQRIRSRLIDLIAYASDASFYRLIPRVVVLPSTIDEIQKLFQFSQRWKIPLTFRAAGTSLSGQAISDGILVDISRYWRGVSIENAGRKVRVQPGVIGGYVNQLLRPYGAKLGPDPASINACMMGGILANNASGMCCGVAQNSYHTLDSLTFVLPNGLVIDTASQEADAMFRNKAPDIAEGLRHLKQKIESNPSLKKKIRQKYLMKNTTGYSLNAFLDFSRPVEIMRHLLIGSEGTLGFIAEAVLNTVPDHPFKYTGLLFFPSIQAACEAIIPLKNSGAMALEIMDRASLRSVQNQPEVPHLVKTLPDEATALLVEYQCADSSALMKSKKKAQEVFRGLRLLHDPIFTTDPREQQNLWKIRKGLFPSIGSVRNQGTTVIIEDVAFPLPALASAVTDLQLLFQKYGYSEGIIFGHAKDGNLHFVITQSFNEKAEVQRYEQFLDEMVNMVVNKYHGALKAEHGTGRNMAPFVEVEWGEEAYSIMKELKSLIDPQNLLNPGVIINSDHDAHVRNLKSLPVIEEEVDKCTECGFCESHCPSRDLTLTPRQRIVVRREMARLKGKNKDRLLQSLWQDYRYDGMDTCAVDGLCATACPVEIDTGQLIKKLRQENLSTKTKKKAIWFANHFILLEQAARSSLKIGHAFQSLLGFKALFKITCWLEKALGKPIPKWLPVMPEAAPNFNFNTAKMTADAVYFPACITRTIGTLPGENYSIPEALLILARRANRSLWIPKDCTGKCCGTPFASKGFRAAYQQKINQLIESFWEWSDSGRLPIIMDTSTCTYTLKNCYGDLSEANRKKFNQLKILDSIQFVHDYLLKNLKIDTKLKSVALHPVCSVVKMNLSEKFKSIAEVCAEQVVVPLKAGCCGFAGDRGLLFPELTRSATRAEATEIITSPFEGYYSCNRTCEWALTLTTGKPYESYLNLVEMATRK